jgi:hypothetical protein
MLPSRYKRGEREKHSQTVGSDQVCLGPDFGRCLDGLDTGLGILRDLVTVDVLLRLLEDGIIDGSLLDIRGGVDRRRLWLNSLFLWDGTHIELTSKADNGQRLEETNLEKTKEERNKHKRGEGSYLYHAAWLLFPPPLAEKFSHQTTRGPPQRHLPYHQRRREKSSFSH